MQNAPRWIGRLAWTGLMALAALAAAGAVRAAPAAYTPSPCTGDFTGVAQKVECGYLAVDETRGSGNGRRVVLPVAVIRAAHPNPKLPPVIYLHGGPGGSTIQSLPRILRSQTGRDLIAQDQDWIFFDQRGSKLSVPELDCGEVDLTDAGPLSEAAARTLEACGQRFAAAGVDLSQYNTAETARDIQDLRRALGIDRFDLFGVSYGTRIGFGVITHAPEGVRAVVLDSVWPPDIDWAVGGPQMISNAAKLIFARCKADPACHAAYPDPAADLDAVARRFLAGPVVGKGEPYVSKGRTYTVDDLGGFMMDTIYDAEGARSLPHDVHAFAAGDFSALDAQMVDRSVYAEAQHLAFLCKERFAFERKDQVTAAPDDPVAQLTVASFRRYFDVCKAYPVGAADRIENAPVTSDIPTLFLSAEFDPGCPPELAKAAARRFSRGQFVMVPNSTHGVLRSGPCGRRLIRAFLQDPTAPLDTSCLKTHPVSWTFVTK
jgi:pimeloyl-ACP methyl ester carboxylesterase